VACPASSDWTACDYAGVEVRCVEARGVSFHTEVEGACAKAQPPLLLLSGGPGCPHDCFHPGLSRLADVRRLIYFDYRGCGSTSTPSDASAFSVEHDAADAEAIRASICGETRVDLLGYSHGGLVALKMATLFPQSIRSLMLVSVPIGESDEAIDARTDNDPFNKAMEKLEYGCEEWVELYWKFYRHRPATPLERKYGERCRRYFSSPRYGLLAKHYADDATDWEHELGKLALPILLICGKHDPIASAEQQGRLVKSLRRGTLRVFGESRHEPFHDEPEEFARAANGS
jgi:pimeloyl-ACP methyl ester carboxylesterase